jgi:DNA processing protein
MSELLYRIALTKIPKVGAVTAKNLIAHCGSAEAVFTSSKNLLTKIAGIGDGIAAYILNADVLKWAEKELEFITKNKIQVLFHTDPAFPRRLASLNDCPMLLYYKGVVDLNAPRIVGIVGTRKPSPYGLRLCRSITEGLVAYNALIISGLAYGIDIAAHRACLEKKQPTVGIMGSGLQRIYPNEHRNTAEQMMEIGGLLTEYPSDQDPDAMHFPMRNRIIAGMSDALVVVETPERGGSMITANMASDYSRDLFAVPGRVGDKQSQGCNDLIRFRKALLIESAEDIARHLRWLDLDARKPAAQTQLFVELSEPEQEIVDLLRLHEDGIAIDVLSFQTQIGHSPLAALLLSLEFKGIIRTLPGKRFSLV